MKDKQGIRIGQIFADGRRIDEALAWLLVTPSESTRSTTHQSSSGVRVASRGCPSESYARRPNESLHEKGRAHPSAAADRPPAGPVRQLNGELGVNVSSRILFL